MVDWASCRLGSSSRVIPCFGPRSSRHDIELVRDVLHALPTSSPKLRILSRSCWIVIPRSVPLARVLVILAILLSGIWSTYSHDSITRSHALEGSFEYIINMSVGISTRTGEISRNNTRGASSLGLSYRRLECLRVSRWYSSRVMTNSAF